MASIHCAPLLAAILLLIPAVLAQSVPTTGTGQAMLDQPLVGDVALPALGGQLTNGVDMAFAVATDKYPNTVNTGAVTLGFTVVTALPVGGQVTFTVPKGYFTNVDSTKVNTFTGTSATCKCVGSAGTTTDAMTCTVAGAGLAAGATTLSMAVGALTTGAPTAAGNYNVQTTTDRQLASAPTTQQIGGVISSLGDFTMATADKLPNRVNTAVITSGFTVITPIPIGGKITLTFAKNYLSAVSSSSVNTFAGKTTATCVLNAATGTGTKDTVVCTTAVDVLAAVAQTLTFAIGAITTGLLPQSASTYTVSSSTDRESASAATQTLGGTLTTKVDVGFTTDSNRVSGTLNTGTVTLGFTTVTAVPIGGKITIALPSKYFSAVDSSKATTLTGTSITGCTASCVLTAGVTGTSVLGIASADTVICTTAGAIVLAATAITVTFPASTVTTGTPQAAATFNVATTMDQQMATAGATKDIGGMIITKTTLVIGTAGDKVPGALNTGTVTFGFTNTNALPVGGKITIALPSKYFSAVDSSKANTLTGTSVSGVTASCVLSAGVTGTSVIGIQSADTVICTTAGAAVAAATAITFTFIAGAVTAGLPQAVATFNVATSPDRGVTATDVITRSPTLTYSVAADKTTARLSTGTIKFNFKLSADLASGGTITIATPATYFTAADNAKANTFTVGGTSSSAVAKCTFAGSGTTTVLEVANADTLICTTETAALLKGEIEMTLIIASVTTGAGANTLTTFNVAASSDVALVAPAATLKLGDQVSTVTAITIASADQLPGIVNTAAITTLFKTVTAVPSGGKVTILLPRGYFAKVDESKANTLTDVSTTTATCALVQATGVATQDSIICTTSGILTAAATQTLTFAAGTITTGGAVLSSTVTASVNIATSVDLKLTSDVNMPQALGGRLSAGVDMAFTNSDDKVPGKFTSNNATITLGFTSVTAIPIGGKITITLPQRYFIAVDGTKDNTVGASATAKCALANVAQTTVPAGIALTASTVATSTTLTVSFVPSIVSGVTQVAIPLVGFSLDSTLSVACAASGSGANCALTAAGKVTAALANGVLTLTLTSDNFFLTKNILTSIVLTGVTTPATAGWATTGISGIAFNPSATVVCTTAGAIVPGVVGGVNTANTFTFVAGSVTIGVGQKASIYQVETSVDLPLAPTAAKATVALGGGVSVGKPLAFANAQDQIPGKVNSGPVSLGATLSNSVPIGGQFLLTFPSNYFTAVNPLSVVTLTKGTRRSLLQTSTLSCVRTAGTPNDQITCTLAGAASGTGAVVITFPAGSLTTGLPTSTSGGFNLATANPPVGSVRTPYFPKAAGSAYGVASLLVALSALLACL